MQNITERAHSKDHNASGDLQILIDSHVGRLGLALGTRRLGRHGPPHPVLVGDEVARARAREITMPADGGRREEGEEGRRGGAPPAGKGQGHGWRALFDGSSGGSLVYARPLVVLSALGALLVDRSASRFLVLPRS